MPLVASVDYTQPNPRIYLSADSVGVDLDTMDIYREVRERRRLVVAERQYYRIIEGGGAIPKQTGRKTEAYVRLLRGCRIVPFNTSHSINLIRDTFTDDNFAGRDCFDRSSLSPSVEVEIDIDIQEVEIREVVTGGGGGGTAPTEAEIYNYFTALNRQDAFKASEANIIAAFAASANPEPVPVTVTEDTGSTGGATERRTT